MVAQSFLWWDAFTSGPAASSVRLSANITGTQHLRRVEVSGSMVFGAYPTNVLGDNGAFIGIVTKFPVGAPPAPTQANASAWANGWWGRPVIDSVELIYLVATTNIPAVRYNFHIFFDYHAAGGGTAGALYVGHQQMYVDANHAAPNVSFTLRAWGYQE